MEMTPPPKPDLTEDVYNVFKTAEPHVVLLRTVDCSVYSWNIRQSLCHIYRAWSITQTVEVAPLYMQVNEVTHITWHGMNSLILS